MAKKIGNIALMIIGIIVAFYLVVLLTAWVTPIMVFVLIAVISGVGIGYLVKRR